MSSEGFIKLFRSEIKFVAGAAKINQLPNPSLSEIAFIGKSNVGKSSLINTICNNSNLAKVSHTPGRTQQINFFSVLDKFFIVDLPGYGFAKVPLSVKEQWEKLVIYYLQNRPTLKLVNLLIDARRGIKANDQEIVKLLLSCNINLQIIFTKVDKVKLKDEIIIDCKNFLASLGHSCNVICTSSRSKEGAKELQYSLAKCIKS